ncbi:MAG: phosphomannomutase/phosphoglucomutase [Rickettsiales bacterium]|nr:phosphomannomutase/phosphoglucomutase [Rickettsiales bacterium]
MTPHTAPATSTSTSIDLLNSGILRAYDIRGIYQETLDESAAYAIGKGYATLIGERKNTSHPVIAVARDGRLSSPALSSALMQGMQSAGARVIDTGLGPTPMLYFAVYHLKADAGIMVTGSHNPPTHNGFKMTTGSMPFYGDDILEIGHRVAANTLREATGSIEVQSVFEDYVCRLMQDFRGSSGRPLHVVWDPGNGAAGEVVEQLALRLPGTHTTLNTLIDGHFPAHHPDPTVPANLVQLIDTVKKQGADLGVAFDGDGDRLGAVDADGNILWGDQMMVFFSRDVLSRSPGACIIADVKASQTLFDDITAHGGRALMWKTGHSLIKAKMKEENAAIAGEMSGHIFFADTYYGFDDGLYAAIRLIDLVAHSPQTLSHMRAELPVVMNTPEIRIDVPAARKFDIVEEIRTRVKAEVMAGKPYELNEVDGVRVKFGQGWWLARASNTQAALIVRCEARDADSLQALKQMVELQLSASGIPTNLDEVESAGH